MPGYMSRNDAIREYSKDKDELWVYDIQKYLFNMNKKYDSNRASIAQFISKHMTFKRVAMNVYRRVD